MNRIEDFFDLDLRIGTIIKIDDFPEARKKAYKLILDFGSLGFYTSSAQITEKYSKEELVGKQIVSIINLGYKRIAGFKSQCLVLGLIYLGGIVLISPENSISNGTEVTL